MSFTTIIILFVVAIIVLAIAQGTLVSSRKEKKQITNDFDLGTYLYGHPSYPSKIEKVKGYNKSGSLAVVDNLFGDLFVLREITNVTVEDKTSFERRVTAARLLAVGVFAFAFKKEVTTERAFLTIECQIYENTESIYFQLDGSGSMNTLTNARRKILAGNPSQLKPEIPKDSASPMF